MKKRKTIVIYLVLTLIQLFQFELYSQKIETVITEGHSYNIILAHTDLERNIIATFDRSKKLIIWDIKNAAKIGDCNLKNRLNKYELVVNIDFHPIDYSCLITTPNRSFEYDLETNTLHELLVSDTDLLAGYYLDNQYWYGQADGMFSWDPDSSKVTSRKIFTANDYYKSENKIYYSYYSFDTIYFHGVKNDDNYSFKIDTAINIYDLYFDPINKLLAYYSAPNYVDPKNFEFSFHLIDIDGDRELKTRVNQEDPDGFAISQSGKYLVFADADSLYSLVNPNVLRIFDITEFNEKKPLRIENNQLISNTQYLSFLDSDREVLFTNDNQLYRYDISSESLISAFPILDSKIDDAIVANDKIFYTTRGFSEVHLTQFNMMDMKSHHKVYDDVALSSLAFFEEKNLLLTYMGDFIDFYKPDSMEKFHTTIFYPRSGKDWRFLRTFKSFQYDTNIVVCQSLASFDIPDYHYVDINNYKQVPTLRNSRFEYFYDISDSTFLGISGRSIGYFTINREVPLAYIYLDNTSDTLVFENQMNESGEYYKKTLLGSIVDTIWSDQEDNSKIFWDGTNTLKMISVLYDTVYVPSQYLLQSANSYYEPDSYDPYVYKFIDYTKPTIVIIDNISLKTKMLTSLGSYFDGSPKFLDFHNDGRNVFVSLNETEVFKFKFSDKTIEYRDILTDLSEYEGFQLDLGDSLILEKESMISFENSIYDDITYEETDYENVYTQLFARNKFITENDQYIPVAPSFEYDPSVFQLNDTLLLLHFYKENTDAFELYRWDKDSLWMYYLDWFRYSQSNTWNFRDINNVHLVQNKILVTGYQTVNIPFKYNFEIPRTTVLNIDNPRPSHIYKESKLNITDKKPLNGKWFLRKPNDVNNRYYFDLINKNDTSQTLRYYVFQDKEWIIQSDSGYYMGTRGAFEFIKFKDGHRIFEFEQFDLKYNRPDIILERLGYAKMELIDVYKKAYQKRLKKMGFTEDMLKDDFQLPEIKIENFEELPTITDDDEVSIDLNLRDSKYKLDRANVWVNDVPIYGRSGIPLRAENTQNHRLNLSIDLGAGNNKIQFSVMNQSGAESYKETYYITSTKSILEPNLYLIAISVSDYMQSEYNLNFAVKDARDLVNLYTESNINTYNNIIVDTLLNNDATIENLSLLRTKLLNTKVNDQVILYVSGHGLLDDNLDFYFASHDMDFSNPALRGISYESLEGLLDSIPARKKLFMMDACHSGEVDKEELKEVKAPNDLLAQNNKDKKNGLKTYSYRGAKATTSSNTSNKLGLQNSFELMQELFTDLNRGSGAMVISAAAGDSYALESNEWNNGVFTYAILNGLKNNAADANGNGEVSVSELRSYVIEQVQELTDGKQKPTSRQENIEFDFRVW